MIAGLLIRVIGLYRKFISPCLPRVCKYHPTCSAYAIEAIRVHGAALAIWRILRCNPFSYGGYDPVPPRIAKDKAGTVGPGSTRPFRR